MCSSDLLNSLEIKAIEIALNSGSSGSGSSGSGSSGSGSSGSGSSGSGSSGSGSSGSGSSGSGNNDSNNDNSGNDESNDSNSNIDGANLYKEYCQRCHKPLNDSTKKGATVGRIKSGMNEKSMQFLKSKLNDQELQAIEKALAVKGVTTPPAPPNVGSRAAYKERNNAINTAAINQWITKYESSNSNTNLVRYVYLPDKIYKNKTHRNIARVCLSKAINMIAIRNPTIVHPIDISDNQGIAFAIKLDDYFENNELDKWNTMGGSNQKFLSVEKFANNIFHFNKYGNLTEQPKSDINENMVNLGIKGKKPDITMAMEKAITYGVRYVESYVYEAKDRKGGKHTRHYWRSGDPVYATDTDTPDGYKRFKAQCFLKRDEERPVPTKNSVIAQKLTWDENGGKIPRFRFDGLPTGSDTHPDICAGGAATASEAWRSLPNGLIQFYLWGNGSQRIKLAASTLVTDPLQRDLLERKELGVGQCTYCHVTGTMYRKSDMATAKAKGLLTNPGVANFWTSQNVIDEYYRLDSELFQQAMKKIVENMSDNKQLNKNLVEFKTDEPCYTTTNYAY